MKPCILRYSNSIMPTDSQPQIKSNQSTIKSENDYGFLAWVFGCLLAMSTLRCAYGSAVAWWAGSVAMATVLGCATTAFVIGLLLKRFPAWKRTGIGLALAAMLLIYLWRSPAGPSLSMIAYRLVQLFLVFGLFAFTSSLRPSLLSVRRFATAYLVTLVVSWGVLSVALPSSGSILPTNPNAIGMSSFLAIVACFLFYYTGDRGKSLLYFLAMIAFFSFLLLLSDSRSSMLAATLFLAVYYCYRSFLRFPVFYTAIYLCVIGSISIMVYINAVKWHDELKVEHTIEDVNAAITMKPINSRERVWTPVVMFIEDNPWTGMGVGWTREALVDDRLSAHSSYLQIGLQTGIPGIVAFLLVLYTIGYGFIKRRSERRFGRLGLSLLFGLIIQSGYESCLTENELPLGITAWALLGICLSLHAHNDQRSTSLLRFNDNRLSLSIM